MTELLPEGVYLHLEEERYFPQGMGSTDWSRLYLRKQGWWWSSALNPDRRIPKATESTEAAKLFGKAMHKNGCEGEKAYNDCFVVMPEKNRLPGLIETGVQARTELEKAGFSPPKSAKNDDLYAMVRQLMPGRPIWDDVMAEFQKTLEIKNDAGEVVRRLDCIPGPDDRAVRLMADTLRADPEIGPLFQFSPDHIPLPEVSILYTDEFGIRRRARLDLLLPSVTIDLKTMAGWGLDKELKFAVPEAAVKRAYHVQMADHHLARKRAYRLIREGKVYGAEPHELEWLKRFPDEASNWNYVWIFYQKPDFVEGRAPVIFPWEEAYGDDLHRRGLRCLYEAIETYRESVKRFGMDKPWTRVEPLHVSTEGNPDRVYIPHYVGGDTPLPNEEELLDL